YRLVNLREELVKLERQGEKSVERLLAGIEASRKQPLWRLLAGLNIRHVGQTVARTLEQAFGTLQEIAGQSEEMLAAVHELGPVIAKSVHQFFESEYGRGLVAELTALGLNTGQPVAPRQQVGSGVLEGQTIVVTGTMVRFTREQIEQLIRDLGGKASGSVSKKTSLVVAGEAAGSKRAKAEELGIRIVSEDEFLALAGQPSDSQV
ncbi:MAG: helix-hairpin-helix domain-containing protein, partial [Planctomyces sp.]